MIYMKRTYRQTGMRKKNSVSQLWGAHHIPCLKEAFFGIERESDTVNNESVPGFGKRKLSCGSFPRDLVKLIGIEQHSHRTAGMI
jgi:hypothetical protein